MANIIEAFPNGAGAGGDLPAGGATGQILAKHSNTDNDTEWIDASSGHTIKNSSGTNMTQRSNLKFVGADITDDSESDSTIVTVDLDNKVDKVEGKGLSTNDYTTAEKTKLADLSNYDDTAISGRVSTLETSSQPKTMSSSVTVGSETETTVEGAIGEISSLIPSSAEPTTNRLATLDDIGTGVQDSRIGEEITKIGLKLDNGIIRPYITVNRSVILPSFAKATIADLTEIFNAYYNGDLSLDDIKNSWSLGDHRTIHISAMDAEYTTESHASQDVEMYIVDFDHDTLTTAEGEITKPLITYAFALAEGGQMRLEGSDGNNVSKGNEGGWGDSPRRTWCNDTCFNALPSWLQDATKSVDRTTDIGSCSQTTQVTSDKLFLASSMNLTGGVATAMTGNAWRDIQYGADVNTQYEYYKTNNLPVSSAVYTTTTMGGRVQNSYYSSYWICANADKTRTYARGDWASGLLIHGCM